MTDRELLELAAKAAGLLFRLNPDSNCDYNQFEVAEAGSDKWWTCWNPLTQDGDALRLAVKLRIDIKAYDKTVRTWVGDPVAQKVIASVEELCGTDPYAATRRAIVRAAAEIAKAQP